MNPIASWLDHLDKGLFLMIRKMFHSRFLEANSGVLGDLYAWVPMFVFLAIVLYLSRPGSAVFSIFFGFAAFVLSFQASMLLANFLYQPSPVQYEYIMHSVEMPAYGRAYGLGLPDWGIAAMVATFHFTRLRIRDLDHVNILPGWVAIILFGLLRVYAGYTYPMGVLMAVLVGTLIAWLMYKLAKSVELISPTLTNSDADQGTDE